MKTTESSSLETKNKSEKMKAPENMKLSTSFLPLSAK